MRNWRAMKEIGVGFAMSPGNIHQAINMDFPTSVGGYEYTKTPDDPCILHLRCCLQGDISPCRQHLKCRMQGSSGVLVYSYPPTLVGKSILMA